METGHALEGIHHITLVASNAGRTVRFYTEVLGLHFVKKTVNFDQPNTYHLYFGDEIGTPGTLVTFFDWPHAGPGYVGVGTTHHLALTVSSFDGLLKWKTRLQHAHCLVAGPYEHRAYRSIVFTDPDGLILEIATAGPGWQDLGATPTEFMPHDSHLVTQTWPEPVESITPDMRLGPLHHIAAIASDIGRTSAFYQELLGMSCVSKALDRETPGGARWYWTTEKGAEEVMPGTRVAYQSGGDSPRHGRIGHGMAHHFAFNVPNDEAQHFWRERLLESGLQVTPVLDRKYFRSIYFQDPDGHILEIATSNPGFLVDQPQDRLGVDLALPAWLEPERSEIERALPPL